MKLAGPVLVVLVTAGCLPLPTSSVALHPRTKRPPTVESSPAKNGGEFSSPAFDASGALLAVYDSGSNLVRILNAATLTPVRSLPPSRRPRRLSFSPNGRFLVIEEEPGWIEDLLSHKGSSASRVDIDSPEAVRDDIQRAEVWDLQTGQTISDLSCAATMTTPPQRGWFWASNVAIAKGYKSSALLSTHFSPDENVFSMLCWDGVQQRWDTRTWERLENVLPPPFWDEWLRRYAANLPRTLVPRMFMDHNVSRSSDGRIVALDIRERTFGFNTLHLWDQTTGQTRRFPGDCGSHFVPDNALSRDGNRLVAVCTSGLGVALRACDLGSGRELPLEHADFGFTKGHPTIRRGGVALSPDGKYLAAELQRQELALLVSVLVTGTPITRSDLRLWSLDTGKELLSLPIDDLYGRADYFVGVDVAFSPDSATLVASGRKLRVYRLSEFDAAPR